VSPLYVIGPVLFLGERQVALQDALAALVDGMAVITSSTKKAFIRPIVQG
jgi:hypothetical protein